MDKREDIALQEGVTRIVDEQGNTLLTIELTPNMLVVLGADGTVIQRSWRDIMRMFSHQAEGSSSRAPEEG